MTTNERRLRLVEMLRQFLAAPDEWPELAGEIREFTWDHFDSSDYEGGAGEALEGIVDAYEQCFGVPDEYSIGWGGLIARYRRVFESLERHWGLRGAPGSDASSRRDS